MICRPPIASITVVLAMFPLSVQAGATSSPAGRTVLDFGTVGDGRTDETPAIQKAVDAGIGGVRLPKGIYRVTRPIVIDLDKTGFTSIVSDGTARIVMAGAGPAFKFIGTHEGTAAPRTFKPNVWKRQRMPMVDGVEIVGAHAEAIGLEAAGTMQLTITRTTIRECLHGIHLTRRNRNIVIADCHIYKNTGIGVFYDDVSLHQSNIIGSHISYCDGGGIVLRGGDVRNVHVGTCDLEANHGRDGPPTANILIDCSSSASGTAEVAIAGCTIQHTSGAQDSANIRILGRGAKGVRGEARWGHVTITGNVLSDVMTNIHLAGTRGVTLTGNTFWMGYKHNLLVEDCAQIVVGSNVFERNPAYDYGSSTTTCNAVVFRNSRDCTLTGLHVEGVHGAEAGVLVDTCDRFNITGCTILDCDPVGLLARNLTRSRISDCLIRDDRPGGKPAGSLKMVGGQDNQVVDNLLSPPPDGPSGSSKTEASSEKR